MESSEKSVTFAPDYEEENYCHINPVRYGAYSDRD